MKEEEVKTVREGEGGGERESTQPEGGDEGAEDGDEDGGRERRRR